MKAYIFYLIFHLVISAFSFYYLTFNFLETDIPLKYVLIAVCFVYTCRRLIDLCFVYTCRRLIDLARMIAGTLWICGASSICIVRFCVSNDDFLH